MVGGKLFSLTVIGIFCSRASTCPPVGRVLHFFSNVKDSDLVTGAAPKPLKGLFCASHLLVRGFAPCLGVYDVMPRLRHVHIA